MDAGCGQHASSCPNLACTVGAGSPNGSSGSSPPASPTGDSSVRRGRLFHAGAAGSKKFGTKLGTLNTTLESLLSRKAERSQSQCSRNSSSSARSPLAVSTSPFGMLSAGPGRGSPLTSEGSSLHSADENQMLALRTLAASPPQPPGELLPLRFALHHIVPLIYCGPTEIRCQGALACVAILKLPPEPLALMQRNVQAAAATRQLLNHLLAVAVGDPEPSTRVAVLKGLQVRPSRPISPSLSLVADPPFMGNSLRST